MMRWCPLRKTPPAAAKDSLYGDIFFLILLRKIKKKMSPYKDNLARSAEKILFTQPCALNRDSLLEQSFDILHKTIHAGGIRTIAEGTDPAVFVNED